ncbi:DUF2271 domain-containing protein [Undibacterium sp. SXout7W]|uniref:DUF2271 domain-containing protein n=1 Tax=Undibacterium sp. SXout7W TaxID=3413049 RepID=UPI003BF1CB30
MNKLLPFAISSVLGSQAMLAVAADMTLKVEIPKLKVAEYHSPYVAIWLEKPDQSFAGNLAVWYNMKKRDNESTKWLKDLRQWWRRSGRDLQMPVDGISGATRTSGEQTLSFSGDKSILAKLPAGEYQLIVEAAREGGGREVVKVPFQWQAKTEQNAKAQGSHELGTVTLNIK